MEDDLIKERKPSLIECIRAIPELLARVRALQDVIGKTRHSYHFLHLHERLNKIMHTLDELLAKVQAETTLVESVTAMIGTLRSQVSDAVAKAASTADASAEIDKIFDAVTANSAALTSAITTNTPAASTPVQASGAPASSGSGSGASGSGSSSGAGAGGASSGTSGAGTTGGAPAPAGGGTPSGT